MNGRFYVRTVLFVEEFFNGIRSFFRSLCHLLRERGKGTFFFGGFLSGGGRSIFGRFAYGEFFRACCFPGIFLPTCFFGAVLGNFGIFVSRNFMIQGYVIAGAFWFPVSVLAEIIIVIFLQILLCVISLLEIKIDGSGGGSDGSG